MTNTYVTALIESLEKKLVVLSEIREKNKEQAELLKDEAFSFDAFDKTAEEKGILIYRLSKLDEGFESVFEKVKDEINANKSGYAKEIKRMQELITEITSQSTAIQAEEARNKAVLEQIFRNERSKIKSSRSSIKAINSYSQAMNYKK